MALEHEEISEQIIGAAFEVHGILGYGFLEKVYQRAMQVELKATGMSVGLLINFGKQKVELKDLPIQENPRFIRVNPRPKEITHTSYWR